MKQQIIQKNELDSSTIFPEHDDDNPIHKNCEKCGQGILPFKYGVCYYCRKQVGYTKYLVISK
jgi:hypothetical protein